MGRIHLQIDEVERAAKRSSEATAADAGLRYVAADEPGITRRRRGRGFTYFDVDGSRITDPHRRERFSALAIPPAWTDVWICADPSGHIQATGRDDRGRKQYRYHDRWREVRDETKYQRLIPFAEALPSIRAHVEHDMMRHGLPLLKVAATVVRLLDETLIRVGNSEYAEENHSYGLTTLLKRHVEIHGTRLEFSFRGKSGVERTVEVGDRRLARIVRRCRDLPGQVLFQYVDDGGGHSAIESTDVNAYLRDAGDAELSAKDFRTWAATVNAVVALREIGARNTKRDRRSAIVRAAERVAERLGNTPAVARSCYVHPAVFDTYERGEFFQALNACTLRGSARLSRDERLVLNFLRRHS